MKEWIITAILTVIIGLISIIFDLENKVLEALLQLISAFIPIFVILKNNPKNYLKFLYFKKSNINSLFKAKILECDITVGEFNEIIQALIGDVDNINNRSKVINKTIGEYNYSADLKVNSSYMSIIYDQEKKSFYLEFEGELSYKNFLIRVEVLYEALTNALKIIKYNEQMYNLTLIYKGEANCSNPFVKNLFERFDDKNVNISYLGKNKTKICISNNRIEFTNNSILNLKNDLLEQLSPFKFK